MFRILVSDPISDEGLKELRKRNDVFLDTRTKAKEEELQAIIHQYDALLVRSQTRVTKNLLSRAENLKVIGRAGVGVDNIDVEAATERGIVVINAPDGNTISTAEHTMAMIMACARHIPQAYRSLAAGKWERKKFKGVELKEKTLGIVGVGRIGTEVVKRAKAFGMHVAAYDPFLSEERANKMGIQKMELHEVIRRADFITVHTPLTKDTRHLLSEREFAAMKTGVRIVNCARGGIIDENALLRAIEAGKVAACALDVFEIEPPLEHPLLQRPEVVATPHLGASTAEAQTNVAIDVCREVMHVLGRQPFKNAVNLPNIAPEVFEKLKPYMVLADQIGKMSVQLVKGVPVQIHVTYGGALNDTETEPLTRALLKGVLAHHFGNEVNDVNVLHLMRLHDLSYSVEKSSKSRGFQSLITVTLKTEQEERTIAGTVLNGYGVRIITIDGDSVDLVPEKHMLLIRHYDKPGVIGQVGSVLGKHEVNIGTMQVGREHIGGKAMMILTIDRSLPAGVKEKLLELDDIEVVRAVNL